MNTTLVPAESTLQEAVGPLGLRTPSAPSVVVDAFAFAQALKTVRRAIAPRSALPALQGVRLVADRNGVHLTGTDLELTITAGLDAEVVRRGAVLIPPAPVADLLPTRKATKGETLTLSIDVEADEVTVSVGARRRVLRTLPLDEYPRLASPEGELIAIDTELIASVLPAVSPDDARPILTAVAIGGGHIVATDSYRLHFTEGPDIPIVLLPKAAAAEVVRAGGTPLAMLAGRDLVFEWVDRRLRIVSRAIEGEFPNWPGLVPDVGAATTTFELDDAAPVIEACVASGRFGGEAKNTPVRLTAGEGGDIEFTTHRQDVGTDTSTVPGRAVGDKTLTVGFNPKYLADLVRDFPGPLRLECDGPLRPAVMRGERGTTRLIMPVRTL